MKHDYTYNHYITLALSEWEQAGYPENWQKEWDDRFRSEDSELLSKLECLIIAYVNRNATIRYD